MADLARFVAGLSSDELAAVYRYRLAQAPTKPEAKILAQSLNHPQIAAAGLLMLNGCQLSVLRWLAACPEMWASWDELVAAVGDRLPTSVLESAVRVLRELALADCDPAPGSGWIATFESVAQAVRATSQPSLIEWLPSLNTDSLRQMARAVGVTRPPTTKEERIREIVEELSDGTNVQRILTELSGPAVELFLWFAGRPGPISATAVDRHYPPPSSTWSYGGRMNVGAGYGLNARSDDMVAVLMAHGLVMPVSAYPGAWQVAAYCVPFEVRLATTGKTRFDLLPLTMPPLRQVDVAHQDVPDGFQFTRDALHLVGFVNTGQCEWRQNGSPYKRSLGQFGKLVGGKSAEYVELLWDTMAGSELFGLSRAMSPTMDLARLDGHSFGDVSADLLVGWTFFGGQRGRMGTLGNLGCSPRDRMLLVLRQMPADIWIAQESLEAWLKAGWPLIFGEDSSHFEDFSIAEAWDELSQSILGRGVATSGEPAIMLPEAHRALLPRRLGVDDPLDFAWDDRCHIQPDRSIVAPPNAHPRLIADLWSVASLESNQGASVFRISASSIGAALNRGMTPAEIAEILRERSRGPLPPTVERLVSDQASRYGQIKVGGAMAYVQTDEPATLEELRQNRKLQGLQWLPLGPNVAAIHGADVSTVLGQLKRAGYLPVEVARSPESPLSVAPALLEAKRKALTRILKAAIRKLSAVEVTWEQNGKVFMDELQPETVQGGVLVGLSSETGRNRKIPLEAIQDVMELDEDW
ncbi:MAG: helicase-associated domain-containing protein [Chloroflexota bacterium]